MNVQLQNLGTLFLLTLLLVGFASAPATAQIFDDEYRWVVDPALNNEHGIQTISMRSRLEFTKIELNASGKKLQESGFDEDGETVFNTIEYEYEGERLSKVWCYDGNSKDTFYQFGYQYDPNGKLNKKCGLHDIFGLADTTFYEYYPNGTVQKMTRQKTLSSGVVQEEEIRFYDEKGRVIELQYPGNEILSRVRYEYLNNRKVVKKTYGENPDVVETISLILLKSGKPIWIGEKKWSDDGFVEALENPRTLEKNCEKTISFTYDSRGFLREVQKPWASYVLMVDYK